MSTRPNDSAGVLKQILDYVGPSDSLKLMRLSKNTSLCFKSILDDIAVETYFLFDKETSWSLKIKVLMRIQGEVSEKINGICELSHWLGVKDKYERVLLWRRFNNKIKGSGVNHIIELLMNERFLRDNLNAFNLNNQT